MLRIRTGFSFRTASGHLDEVMDRLQEIGATAAPITDRASTFGWYKWSKICNANNIKPVYGVELAVTPSANEKKPRTDFWLFLARDDIGPINRLVELATTQFRYQPLLTVEQAFEAAKDVNVVMGHRPQVDWTQPVDGVYLGLSPSLSKGVLNQAKGWPLAATGDNRFTTAEDAAFYETLVGRNAEMQTYPQHILDESEWRASVARLGLAEVHIDEAIKRSRDILEASTASLRRASLPVPEKPKTLLEMCMDGAKDVGCDLVDPVYADRLAYELGLIDQKGYEDYFYIVADVVQWARKQMIVGPARGSSCGSLVCYLLKITTVDPIPHGLIFERFIDINRDDMPDIDIDFSDQQRSMVFTYLAMKYGSEKTARLGTVAMFKPRSALAEVGAALRIPRWKCDAVAESLLERSSGDSRALQTLEDTLKQMPAGQELLETYPHAMVVTRFEGHPRHASQHAAGVVLASKPITDYVAVDHRSGAAMCDKKDAEDGYNLLKIDALGLTQLSVFEDALEMAGLPQDHLEKLPLTDAKAFDVLNKAHYSGIFQFNGMALQSIVKQFKVQEFEDIVSITALGRPGPLASGGAHEWIRRRNGANPVTYPHKIFEPYLKDTLGIVLYQEQVMEIGRNVGDLDWGQVTLLRKAMSKSLGAEYFDQFGDPWKKAAIKKGVSEEDAKKVWDDLCAYGSWSFNKSHSVAYGLISYWCCWLKAHHPFEFAAATLTHENDPNRQIQLLREMTDEGYDYIPYDAETSGAKWSVGHRDGKRILVGPLHNVEGIGPKIMNGIIGARARGERMSDRAQKLLANGRTPIDTLWPVRDAIHTILPDPTTRNIYTPPTPVVKLQIEESDYEALIFCTFIKINPRDENEAVNIARRGYEIKDSRTASLNLQMADDTDIIFGKVSRYDFERIGRDIVNRGRPSKCLYAVKGMIKGHRGRVGSGFRMMMIKSVRYIGDIDDAKGKRLEAAE